MSNMSTITSSRAGALERDQPGTVSFLKAMTSYQASGKSNINVSVKKVSPILKI